MDLSHAVTITVDWCVQLSRCVLVAMISWSQHLLWLSLTFLLWLYPQICVELYASEYGIFTGYKWERVSLVLELQMALSHPDRCWQPHSSTMQEKYDKNLSALQYLTWPCFSSYLQNLTEALTMYPSTDWFILCKLSLCQTHHETLCLVVGGNLLVSRLSRLPK